MKKLISLLLAAVLACGALFSLTSCGKGITIGVPNDATNEARALELLEAKGLITLSKEDGVLATVKSIKENPYNIKFREVDAAQLPSLLPDLDYAVINSNYALAAELDAPFTTEGTDVSYPNIIAVKSGKEGTDKIKALVAAVNSTAVQSFITAEYGGKIVCDLKNVTDGYDLSVDYAALAGQTIKIAASPTPHADILAVAKNVLAAKGVTLSITTFSDYVQPNMVVDSGEFDANYFQHVPYLNDFNAENGTNIVSVLEVHHEPMGIYSKKYDSLDAITANK